MKKIYSYLYLYILFIAADAAFIILFWPKYNPELTTFTWHVVHLIGITYLVIIIFFTNKVDKYVDIKIEKENEYLQITEKEEKSFYIFSIICIFILLFSLIAQFIQMLGIVTYNYFDYPHPFAFLWLIGYIPIIAIFCFSIKFMKICKSDRFKSKIRMCFYFFILFLFIFFPYPYIYVSSLTWIMFDVIGIFIYLYFYIICIKNTVIPQ